MYESNTHRKMRLNYSYYLDGIKYNAIKIAKKINVPTLVVVGDKDVTVFFSKVKEFFDLLDCKKEFHLIKGVNHWFGNKGNKEVFKYTNSWFIKWLK